MSSEQFPESSNTPIEPIAFDATDGSVDVPQEKDSTEPMSVRELKKRQQAEGWEISRLNHQGRFAEAQVMQMNRELRDTKEGLRSEQNKIIADIARGVRGLRKTSGGLLAGGIEYEAFARADKAQIEEWVLDLLEGFSEADTVRKSEVVCALRDMRKMSKPDVFDMVASQFFPDLTINLDDPKWDVVVPVSKAEKPSFFRRIFGGGN